MNEFSKRLKLNFVKYIVCFVCDSITSLVGLLVSVHGWVAFDTSLGSRLETSRELVRKPYEIRLHKQHETISGF
jgi:hypothetical protein